MENIYSERIAAIRQLMEVNGWDFVIVSGSDPHSSEYVAPRWQQVSWVSGFSGEAGDLVISLDHAGLWTDSRYFIQAARQLEGTGIGLHKLNTPGCLNIPEWIASRDMGTPGRNVVTVAVDGLCQNINFISVLSSALEKTKGEAGYEIINEPDLLDALWEDRPSIPQTPVLTIDENMVGMDRAAKISWLREQMRLMRCDKMLLGALDEIAWLLNVRGSDIEYNPLVISYLVVTRDTVGWAVRKAEGLEDLDPDTEDSFDSLEADGVDICLYDDVPLLLASDEDDRIFIDPSTMNYDLYAAVLEEYGKDRIIEGTSPVPLKKAQKTPEEIACMREAHLEDGLAMEQFLYWLEREAGNVTEWEASEKLTSFRAAVPGYMGNSFGNISAYGPNAALPHYVTSKEDSPVIGTSGLYLVDSGGQYLFGTTDVTRTVPMGECTELEKEDYTLVLKGMIDLAMAVFPRGTAGCQIDVLARNPLWQKARNFGHGTGHGVGFFLCVHEGPQGIRQNFLQQPILPGMITSDEPGLYREGCHGIRHENLVLCEEYGKNEFGDWLHFETLTLVHIDTDPVIPSLLGEEETDWLNAYNERVFQTLSPRLDRRMVSWLEKKTRAI